MLAGLGADSDRALTAFGKKLRAEAVKTGCNATGACPIPKTATSPDGASPPGPAQGAVEKVDTTLLGNTISTAAAAPASAASGNVPRQEQQQQ